MAVVDQGFISLASFLTGVLVSRSTSKEEYGLYVLGMTVIWIFLGIHRSLVILPFTVYSPRLSAENLKIYQASTFLHSLFFCFVLFIPCIGFHLFSTCNMFLLSLLISGVASSFLLREYIRSVYLAKLKVFSCVFADMTATFAQLVLVVLLFKLNMLNNENAFFCLAITSLLSAAYMLWSQRREMFINRSKIFKDLSFGWRLSKFSILDSIFSIGSSEAYPWLLLYFLDSKSVAIFGVCVAAAGMGRPILRGANAYIQPRMAHSYSNNESVNKDLNRIMRLSMWFLGVPLAIWLFIGSFFGDEIITTVYTSSYSGYGYLFALLLFRYSLDDVLYPLYNYFQIIGRAEVPTISFAIGTVVTIGLGPILISNMGLIGVGITSVITGIIIETIRLVVFKNLIINQIA